MKLMVLILTAFLLSAHLFFSRVALADSSTQSCYRWSLFLNTGNSATVANAISLLESKGFLVNFVTIDYAIINRKEESILDQDTEAVFRQLSMLSSKNVVVFKCDTPFFSN